ncbi:MAG: CHAT domain-containing protein, partial [Calditrichaeota bacterium]|nr:CHAT domain-containing protein [Calditrichota bacterium]
MIRTVIQPNLTSEQVNTLKSLNQEFVAFLERKIPAIKPSVLLELKDNLSEVVKNTPEWVSVFEKIKTGGNYHLVQLQHADTEILTLPWQLANNPLTGEQISEISQHLLVNSLENAFSDTNYQPEIAAPLKILIMISSPEDLPHTGRLSYEDEEFLILKAFQPLLETGNVEIDFTDDGSLEALQRKLTQNRYHVLHFSGHGSFKDGKGSLHLENPLNLNGVEVSDREFANTVNINPDYRPPLVLLSSCQTAAGDALESELNGVANQLLRVGVPAVIAMSASILDWYANIFSHHFYLKIADKQRIYQAFAHAVSVVKSEEFKYLSNSASKQKTPFQWLIPRLFISRPAERLVEWQTNTQPLRNDAAKFVLENNRLLLNTHHDTYRFIGRRREKAAILPALHQNTPVLLTGQGGVGKTALAEYLVQRLIAATPKTLPLLFTQNTPTIEDALQILQNALKANRNYNYVGNLSLIDKAMEKFDFLCNEIEAAGFHPVFVFDNLEDFQQAPGEGFQPENQDMFDLLHSLCEQRHYPVLLTGRYPIPGLPNVKAVDLTQAPLNDYWRRCQQLQLASLHRHLPEQAGSFFETVKWLHNTLGGNYRALEFLEKQLTETPETLEKTLESMEAIEQELAKGASVAVENMRENLKFEMLSSLVSETEMTTLQLLGAFDLPVTPLALHLQTGKNHLPQL